MTWYQRVLARPATSLSGGRTMTYSFAIDVQDGLKVDHHVEGHLETPSFVEAVQESMRRTFAQLTDRPPQGGNCHGPFRIKKLLVEEWNGGYGTAPRVEKLP